MECENLENCGFFKKYRTEEHLACSAFIGIYCKGMKKEACARYTFKKENNRPPSDDLLPTGKKQFTNTEEIKKKAGACIKNYKCLDGNIDDLCRINIHLSEDTQIIDCPDNAVCPFLKDYGSTKICGCPIRSAIYKEYGV